MTLSKEDMHVYLRHIDERERTSLSVLVGQIAPGSSVLDVGCGSGALGQYLHTRRQCTVDGVTFNEAEAEMARASYRKVEVADLERASLAQLFAGQRYDAIVCADILEHLRQPEALLRAMQSLLAPQGLLLISIPNSTYAGLLAELMEGEFLYRQEGLLDATHVRHVTRKSLLRMLEQTGWQVQRLETIERALGESEFKTPFDRLPPTVARHLLARADALTYQFIVAAAVATQAADNTAFLLQHTAQGPHQEPQPQALFSAQLYWDDGQGWAEEHKCVQAGVIGQARQTLRFALPPLPTLCGLKFDPADRPGVLHLHSLRLCLAQASCPVWQWHSDDAAAHAWLYSAERHELVWGHSVLGGDPAAGVPAILTGQDPWFKLPMDPEQLQAWAAQGQLVLEVELDWPMSADYLSLATLVGPLQAEQEQLRQRLQGLGQERQALAAEHARLLQYHGQTVGQLDKTLEENRRLFGERERAQAAVVDLHQQLRGMAEHVQNLRNSRVFRYTRPVVRLRDWLKGRRPDAQAADAVGAVPAGGAIAGQAALSSPLGRSADGASGSAPAADARAAPASDTVDIIVPIYRGLADTQLCVQSVLASAVVTPYRLILINDCSPEPELTAWLREIAAQEPRITLLENTENLGFVGTVNRGMRQSEHNDVLLLNSDTEVANDWLDRLRQAAWRPTPEGAQAGSVTPFSGNATICSYPNFCEDNPLPPGHTTASIDRLFAAANPGQSVDVPTGVGFCMYIRRDCLDAVGLFDEEHFGKGYGEENDFCQRALRQGWRSLHALDTYVRHTGGVSFGQSKSPREQAAMLTLRRLHPDYELQVHDFVRRDPARGARLAVDWLRATDSGARPVILAVQHQRGGGTERHVLELAQTLAERATYVSLRPVGAQQVCLQLIELDARGQASLSPRWTAQFDTVREREDLLQLLAAMPIAHIHYHHLLGHDRLVWDLPQLLGVRYSFTAHDFYSYCTHITMTGRKGRYEADASGECCGGQHPPPIPALEADIHGWRTRNRLFLEGARHVLTPSLDTAARLRRFAPRAAVRYAPHTDLQPQAVPQPQPHQLAPDQPLRIAVIGALSIIKGADVLEQVAQLARQQGQPLEFHLIGYGYRHLQTAPATALHVHGQYEEKDLPAILQRLHPDLIWLPAQWPETYSYTLSAALQHGCPVAVPDIGAFAERVAGRAWSWVLPWDLTPAQWLEHFIAMRTQHFLPAQPPAVPAMPAALQEQQAEAAALPVWDYHGSDYLPDQTDQAAGADLARLTHVLVHATRPGQGGTAAAQGLRAQILRHLVRLRALPVMRPIVRAIPAPVQTRLKTWLQR